MEDDESLTSITVIIPDLITCTTIPLGRPATLPPVFGTNRTLVT